MNGGMDNTKIALFHPSLEVGGAERVLVNLARGFVERGIEVDVVLARAEGPYLSQLPHNVGVVNLGARHLPFESGKAVMGLAEYLRATQPKALLASADHYNYIPLIARKIARSKTRIVVSFHMNVTQRSKTTPSLKARMIPHAVRCLVPLTDAVVAVSRGVAKDLERIINRPYKNIHVIYNPVITNELRDKADEPVEHPWFRDGEPPVVLGVGRLVPPKDFATLIHAFALVRSVRQAKLVILGEGEERPRLEALARQLQISNDVDLPGFVDNPYKYMKRAAVFVLSSRREGLANVLIEAMAVGTPVVSTDCPSGPAEILENGRWGRLVPVGNPELLAKAIIESLSEPRRSEDLIRRSEDFRAEKAVNQYLQLLLPFNEDQEASHWNTP